MKAFVLAAAVLILSACAVSPPPKANVEKASNANASLDSERELAANILHMLLAKRGPGMMCLQEGYAACFDQTQEDCLAELAGYSPACADLAKVKSDAASKEDAAHVMGEAYGACVIGKQLAAHIEQVDEIGSCMEGVNFDQTTAMEAMLGSESK